MQRETTAQYTRCCLARGYGCSQQVERDPRYSWSQYCWSKRIPQVHASPVHTQIQGCEVGSDGRKHVMNDSAWGRSVVRIHLPYACRQHITREESFSVTLKFPFVFPAAASCPFTFLGRISFCEPCPSSPEATQHTQM